MKRLREIRIVTHCVTNLDAEVDAWSRYLGYVLKDRGHLSAELCAAWNATAETGLPYAIMAPANDTPVYIRFIESGERVGYWPPVTWGWNATEILVQNPDELAQQLQGSPIKRFGGPMDLYQAPKAPRAIQTLGPSGAMLYFARLLPGGSRYGLHGAKIPVDRIFNVILGGPSLDDLRNFYGETMGLRVGAPVGFVGTLAAQACDAPPNTEFPICVAPLRARNSILELDEYPKNSSPRHRDAGRLPGGMSMVGFDTPTLDDFPVTLRAEPASIESFPYNGARVAVAEGPAGEWLELIEKEPN